MLSKQEQAYFARQIMLEQIGEAGQQQWLNARVVIVGVGGLGCPAALYLAAAGIGHITLIDGDSIEKSNLSRQILFSELDIGENKADVAATKLQAQFDHLTVLAIDEMLDDENALTHLAEADVVLDCSDNMATRYLLNDSCQQLTIPLVIGAATGFDGQHLVFNPNNSESACYQCLYPENVIKTSNNCQNIGIINAVLPMIAAMQSLSCLKLLVNLPVAINQLAMFDGLNQQWQYLTLSKQANCSVCNNNNNR